MNDLCKMLAEPQEFTGRLVKRRTDRSPSLDLGLEDLTCRAHREFALAVGVEDRVCALNQIERRGIQQHELLLDAQRVGLRGAETVLRDA